MLGCPPAAVTLALGTVRGYICAVEQTGQQDRTWEVLCHLSALSLVVPFLHLFNVLGPLIVWFIRKEASPSARSSMATIWVSLSRVEAPVTRM